MHTSRCNSVSRPRTQLIIRLFVKSYFYCVFSGRLLIYIIASYIAIKSKQARIIKKLKFKKEVGIDYIYIYIYKVRKQG